MSAATITSPGELMGELRRFAAVPALDAELGALGGTGDGARRDG
jgi:hypothetical protein